MDKRKWIEIDLCGLGFDNFGELTSRFGRSRGTIYRWMSEKRIPRQHYQAVVDLLSERISGGEFVPFIRDK